MTSKWDAVQGTFSRVHDDLFPSDEYLVEFFNYSQGTYDPSEGEMTGQSRTSIGTADVEIVPPNMDTSVENTGTDLNWDTSIRFPINPIGGRNGYGTSFYGSGDYSESTTGGSLYGTGSYGDGLYGKSFVDSLTPLGVNSKRPTEVEVKAHTDPTETVYELHSYREESGSGFLLCRLVEQ